MNIKARIKQNSGHARSYFQNLTICTVSGFKDELADKKVENLSPHITISNCSNRLRKVL
jgi:hypothetical protein